MGDEFQTTERLVYAEKKKNKERNVMSSNTDELINDPDQKEQAILELLKSVSELVEEDDLDKFVATPESLLVYEVSKEMSQMGAYAGRQLYLHFEKKIPEKARGCLVFSFSGYMDTRKELFEIPQVLSFVRGFLFGDGRLPDASQAQRALRFLFDEQSWAMSGGQVVIPMAFDAAGALWCVALAFSGAVYSPNDSFPSGWGRDIDINRAIYKCLTSNTLDPMDLVVMMGPDHIKN